MYKILRLTVSAPKMPATITQARKKILTAYPGIQTLVGGQRLGRRGKLGRQPERLEAERLIPQEHFEHQEIDVQQGDQGNQQVGDSIQSRLRFF
jgi:hypothetical protein